MKEEKLNEEKEMEEVKQMELAVQESGNSIITDFNNNRKTGTKKFIQSTVEDPKILFNLEDHVDFKLNDMEGKEITVTDVVVKTYEKEIPERLNEYTGELETIERTMTTTLIDDANTSYVTASKLFAMRIIELVQMYGIEKLHQGIKIRITKTEHKNGNKKLGFEVV